MDDEYMPQDPKLSICPGCSTYVKAQKVRDVQYKAGNSRPRTVCAIYPTYNAKVCPCSTCLVKMVCNDICDELTVYKESYLYGGDYTRPIPK